MSMTLKGAGPPDFFDPEELPGYIDSPYSFAQLRGAGKLWQDAAKTVPAVADSDPIRVAVCGATDWTAPSDAARPLLYAEGGGKWSADFDGIDDSLSFAGVVLSSATYAFVTNGAFCPIGGASNCLEFYYNGTAVIEAQGIAGIGSAAWSTTSAPTVMTRAAGAGWAIRRAGIVVGSGTSAVATPGVVSRIGDQSGTSHGLLTGRLKGFIVSNAVESQLTAIENYLASL